MSTPHSQIAAVHTLLSRGQRPLRIHRHTLLLWGGTAGILCTATDPLVRSMNFSFSWQVALAVFVILATVFGFSAWLDRYLTLRFTRKNDLTVPFAQEQITKVWWLLVAIGIVLTSGMAMNGGDTLIYCFWIAIFGIGLFIHGAFSEELPEWVGAGMLLLGIIPIVTRVPYQETRWLAACAFGIGLPVLSLMLDGGQEKHFVTRLLQSLLWLATVLVPALTIYHWTKTDDRAALPKVPLASFAQAAAGRYVLSLPAGTALPLMVTIDGPFAATESNARVELVLKQAVDVEMRDGAPTGFYQYGHSPWLNFRESFWIRSMIFNGDLSQSAGPRPSVAIRYNTDRRP